MASPLLRQESEMEAELKLALEEAGLEAGVDLTEVLNPRALFLIEDPNPLPACELARWLASTRRRTAMRRASSLSTKGTFESAAKLNLELQLQGLEGSHHGVVETEKVLTAPSAFSDEVPLGTNFHERLSKAMKLCINSAEFTWEKLVSLHHAEHAASSKCTVDETAKTQEVTVNSGGVVYFAIFKLDSPCETKSGEAAVVLKFTPSRLTTQSERLGYELAKHLGVCTPESRVIHKGTPEWVQIQAAADRCLSVARTGDDEMQRATFQEFLETLNRSSCLLLMGYIHGYPIVESVDTFKIQETAERTAAALGRVFVLDLVLRNEDRLPCHHLGWRGNPANLLCTGKPTVAHIMHHMGLEHLKKDFMSSKTTTTRKGIHLAKEQKARSFDGSLSDFQSADSFLQKTWLQDTETVEGQKSTSQEFHIVAIDSGVPRRPPSRKRENDRLQYPKLVELLLNISSFAADLLFEISWSNFGFLQSQETSRLEKNQCPDFPSIGKTRVTHAFQRGFRGGIMDMRNLHLFLLKLYRRLDTLLRKFILAISRTLPSEKEDHGVTGDESTVELMSRDEFRWSSQHSHQGKQEEVEIPKEHAEVVNAHFELGRVGSSMLSKQDELVISSFESGTVDTDERGCPSVKHHCLLNKRLTLKLKGVNRTAKVDSELNAELIHWNEVLCREGQKICQEKGFVTGFLEGGGSHSVVDSYELKVRLEHVLDRMALILKGANTERPSCVLENLYIGGALAGRSVNTLQCIGITHILCLCPTEIEPPEDDYLNVFEYNSFQVLDMEEADISSILDDACNFIEIVEKTNGKALVHCFEGKSRSAMVVLAYLMMRKKQTLLQAWTHLKSVHRRAQPNDGFMRTLVTLDKQLHGKNTMNWSQKKPVIQTCPICSRSVGINKFSLKTHLERSHPGANNTDIGDSEK